MTTAPLGELTEPVKTWNPRREADSVFQYLDLSAVDNTSKSVTTATPTVGSDAPSRARQLVAAGDVLVSTVRPNLNAVAVVPPELDGATASTGFTVLRPGAALDGRFLFHWVRSPDFIADMVRQATGASYPAVSDRIVKASKVPAPALAEQRRIAAILDHADALRAKRCQVLTHLDSLTQSIFKGIVGDDYWRSVSASASGSNEAGWPWVPLTDVSRLATGHTPDRKRAEYWEGGEIPWISLPEIRSLDGQTAWRTGLTITDSGLANSSAVLLPVGTVCFSRTASVGFVTKLGVVMATSQDFHNWVPGPDLDSDYLMAALRYSRRHLLSVSDGSIHRTIYQRTAQTFRVLLPPLNIQREFAERAAAVDTQRAAASHALAADEALCSSLQSRAFRGEL